MTERSGDGLDGGVAPVSPAAARSETNDAVEPPVRVGEQIEVHAEGRLPCLRHHRGHEPGAGPAHLVRICGDHVLGMAERARSRLHDELVVREGRLLLQVAGVVGPGVQGGDPGARGGVAGIGSQHARVQGVCFVMSAGERAVVLAMRRRMVVVDLPEGDLLDEPPRQEDGGELIVRAGAQGGAEPGLLRPRGQEVAVHGVFRGVGPEHAQQAAQLASRVRVPGDSRGSQSCDRVLGDRHGRRC
ncbi:hypothetical protein [Nonomuraea sp. GTA35]|uniref:hypothetical protein n=1 Tax=Nonomuraea sp. GTA35 TaxID=1676746 RepID=UPI0035BFF7E0